MLHEMLRLSRELVGRWKARRREVSATRWGSDIVPAGLENPAFNST
jgi:hypothetical protein